MSCVLYAEGALWADGRAWGGQGCVTPGGKRKVHLLPNGNAVGIVSAVVGEPERFLAWLTAGADPEAWKGDKPDLRAILLRPDGTLLLYDDSIWPSGPITTDLYAIGSGSDFALGAMSAGAAPLQALAIAARWDVNTGAPFATVKPETPDGPDR